MYAAKSADGKYALFVHFDEYAESPRTSHDNLGTMVCWHRDYNLGDKHDYGEPLEFLRDVYEKSIQDNGAALVEYLKSGEALDAKLVYNEEMGEWDLLEKENVYAPFSKTKETWTFVQSAPECQLRADGWFWDYMTSVLYVSDYIRLLEKIPDFVMLPLYLYDHSGLAMRTSDFGDRWDSGQVGWIYANGDTLWCAYGSEPGQKQVETAKSVLEAEVESYNQYLQNNCWFFRMYENGEEADCCGGFIGYVESCGIDEYLPEDARDLVSDLEWTELSEEEWLRKEE